MQRPEWPGRVQELITRLELIPQPEGGHYRQIFRSAASVQPADGRPARPALTTIYFLLIEGAVSCWHRVASDEVWHFYEGAPLELVTADREWASVGRHTLGTLSDAMTPVCVVRAGDWQAARSMGAYTLVGCTVGPGFDFEDFEMMREGDRDAQHIRERWPALSTFVRPDDA